MRGTHSSLLHLLTEKGTIYLQINFLCFFLIKLYELQIMYGFSKLSVRLNHIYGTVKYNRYRNNL